jgi:hypothetical protein
MQERRAAMAVRIRLSDGSAFVIDSTFDELQKDVATALAEDVALVTVRNGDGQLRSINPRSITYIEETSDDELTPREEETLEALHERHRRQPQPQ